MSNAQLFIFILAIVHFFIWVIVSAKAMISEEMTPWHLLGIFFAMFIYKTVVDDDDTRE